MLARTTIFIYFLISTSLFGQKSDCNIVLKGLVSDSLDTDAFHYVSIEVLNNDKNISILNKNGAFRIENICKGIVNIHFSHLDCEHIDLSFFITKDTFINVNLPHTLSEVGNAKVTSKIEKNNELLKVSLRQLELSKGQSIAEMMQGIIGVSLLKTGGSIAKPIVNGLHSNRVIILNNGIRQEGQNWGMEHAPEIDGFLATDIQLLKGNEALRYAADGIGGVLLIKPFSLFNYRTGKLKGEINTIYNTNGRGYGFSGIIGSKVSYKIPIYWRIQGTYKRNGNIKTPSYFLANTSAKEINYSASLGFQNKRLTSEIFYSYFSNEIGIFSGSHIGNLTDLQNAFSSNEPLIKADFSYQLNRPNQDVKHQLLKISSNYLINPKNKLEFNLAYQKNHRQEFDILRSANSFAGPSFDYYIKTYLADATFVSTNFHKVNFKIGTNFLFQSNAYLGRFFIPGFYQKAFAAFFLADKTIHKLKIETAFRYDVKKLTSYLWRNNILNIQPLLFNNATYLLLAHYKLNNKLILSLGNNSAWRPPAPNELYTNGLHQGLAAIEVGDSTLKPERSFHSNFILNYASKKTRLETELYHKYISNFINLIPSLPPQLTIRGAFPVFKYVQNNASIYGINFAYTQHFKHHLFSKINTSILYGTNTSQNIPLPQMPPVNIKANLGIDSKLIFFQLWSKYTFTQYRYILGSDFMVPPAGFFLFGVDANYEFKIRKNPIKFNFSINNLTNNKYREYLNRFRYFTNEQGFNLTSRLIIPF